LRISEGPPKSIQINYIQNYLTLLKTKIHLTTFNTFDIGIHKSCFSALQANVSRILKGQGVKLFFFSAAGENLEKFGKPRSKISYFFSAAQIWKILKLKIFHFAPQTGT